MNANRGPNGVADRKSGRSVGDGMPRWVKIFGIVTAIAVVVFIGLHGGHGIGHQPHGGMMGHLAHVGVDAQVPGNGQQQP